ISTILYESQQIAVQVIKDPLGNKGARLTTRISLPSRYLVYMPDLSYVGISQRIEDEVERERLKICISAIHPDEKGGFIARTAAEGVEASSLEHDYHYLLKYWKNIQNRIAKA